jgi:drug/metabolite transporter (DMT)-like permease
MRARPPRWPIDVNDAHSENGGRRTGPWLILAAATLWSTAGAAIKLCGLSGWQINFGRSAVAALFLAAIIPGARRRPDRSVGWVAVAYAFTVLLFVLANKATTSANAIFLQDTAPVWVLLLSPLLLQERPSRGELLSAPLFLVGLLLFPRPAVAGQAVGNVIAVASGVAFALCILGLRKLGARNVGAIVWETRWRRSCPAHGGRGPAPTARDLGIVLFLGCSSSARATLFARGSPRPRSRPRCWRWWSQCSTRYGPTCSPGAPGPWAIRGGAVILAATLWRTLAPWLEARRRTAPARPG